MKVIEERRRETEQGLLVARRLDIIETDQGRMFKIVGMFTIQNKTKTKPTRDICHQHHSGVSVKSGKIPNFIQHFL